LLYYICARPYRSGTHEPERIYHGSATEVRCRGPPKGRLCEIHR
jgi:hypothetical protein